MPEDGAMTLTDEERRHVEFMADVGANIMHLTPEENLELAKQTLFLERLKPVIFKPVGDSGQS